MNNSLLSSSTTVRRAKTCFEVRFITFYPYKYNSPFLSVVTIHKDAHLTDHKDLRRNNVLHTLLYCVEEDNKIMGDIFADEKIVCSHFCEHTIFSTCLNEGCPAEFKIQIQQIKPFSV